MTKAKSFYPKYIADNCIKELENLIDILKYTQSLNEYAEEEQNDEMDDLYYSMFAAHAVEPFVSWANKKFMDKRLQLGIIEQNNTIL